MEVFCDCFIGVVDARLEVGIFKFECLKSEAAGYFALSTKLIWESENDRFVGRNVAGREKFFC